jgi:hypothetical protein
MSEETPEFPTAESGASYTYPVQASALKVRSNYGYIFICFFWSTVLVLGFNFPLLASFCLLLSLKLNKCCSFSLNFLLFLSLYVTCPLFGFLIYIGS